MYIQYHEKIEKLELWLIEFYIIAKIICQVYDELKDLE
jgi:hypothetical protein